MSFKSSKSILKRLLWKEPALISTIDDLVILESQDVDKIRKKLSKNFNVRRKFRWRFHPQEDISVIHYAGARASRKAVSCLVEQGADVNSQTNSQGLTPLHFAVLFSNLDVMEELVNRGANINAKEFGRGYTPLHYACERRNLGAVKCLLGLLADQDILDDCGRTPLAMAKDMNCDQICKVLTGCKQASDLKTNITFLAGEQVRQKEQLQDFKDEVQKKFEEYDYWRNMMENRVSEAEKYQNLRSMREARQAKPMFFSQQISSRASSVSNLSEESESHRPKIMHISGNRDIGGGSMRNLAKKFEDFPAFERRGQTRRMNSSASSYSISTMSSVFSEHDSGLCSRPESRISGAIEIDCETCSNFSYKEASLIQLKYPQLIQQMCPTAVLHKLFAENKVTLAFKEKLKNLNDYQKTEEILDHVMKADYETFHIFLQALHESGQAHLSDLIQYNQTPYIYV